MATAEEIQAHYDLDNDFFELFLDKKYRAYSCGVWDDAESLEDAQRNKLARLAGFAGVSPGATVLDIGCGWGGMMRFCTEERGAKEAVGLTLSKAQYDFVRETKTPALKVHLCSWKDYEEEGRKFDAVVSIGAFEHFASLEDRRRGRQVGIYRDFFRICREVSTPGARLGLQTIVTLRTPDSLQSLRDARFLLTSIFQGTALPTVDEIHAGMAGIYEEVESTMIGSHYAETLLHWQERLEANDTRIIAHYGRPVFDRHREYFVAARRSFAQGYIDLRQMSLRPVGEAPTGGRAPGMH